MLKIEKQGLFLKALIEGVNLFTGAGFSVLPDERGCVLPNANELCLDICKEFSISEEYADNLGKLSTIVGVQAKDEFDRYLRSKFTVSNYNKLYDNLNLINIEAFITTNIDNIIQCVMDKSSRYFLNNIAHYGATKKSHETISFVPLHGNVKDYDSKLYFGNFELANVNEDNPELFNLMFSRLLEESTFFWGYGFNDAAVEKIVAKIITKKKQDIWIQCLPDSKNIDFFRSLGCYIIEGTTEEILQWIGEKLTTSKTESQKTTILEKNSFLKQFMIPTINQIEVVPREDFYRNGRTHWHCILAGHPYNTSSINDIYEEMQYNKNIIITGMPLSGKSVTLMQLAARVNVNLKFFIQDFTEEKAKLFINSLKGAKATVFADEFCEDIIAYKEIMKNANISFIGITDNSSFETTKHLIEDVKFKRIEFGELSRIEAQKVFDHIPKSLRESKLKYKSKENEKYSMFELTLGNIKGILSENRIKRILDQLKEISPEGFEIVILAVYFKRNKSILNTDVLLSYFDYIDYKTVMKWVREVQDYLLEIDVVFEKDKQDQDYFNLRSDLFSFLAGRLLNNQKYNKDYSNVVRKLIMNVPPYKIYKHYIFKRTAYDASFFKRLFNNEAHDLYQKIYDQDSSAYTLQQWALYKSYLKDYTSAFIDIDKALTLQNNNFSIQNSRAIILFEANKEKNSELALEGMEEAMRILQKCYRSDKRKNYHAIKYTEFALYLSNVYNLNNYVDQALNWMESIIMDGNSSNWEIKNLRKRLIEITKTA